MCDFLKVASRIFYNKNKLLSALFWRHSIRVFTRNPIKSCMWLSPSLVCPWRSSYRGNTWDGNYPQSYGSWCPFHHDGPPRVYPQWCYGRSWWLYARCSDYQTYGILDGLYLQVRETVHSENKPHVIHTGSSYMSCLLIQTFIKSFGNVIALASFNKCWEQVS